MADLRLTHDPESGCLTCPVNSAALYRCRAVDRSYEKHWLRSTKAPDWCPLRSGTVTVAPPGEKSPPDGGER